MDIRARVITALTAQLRNDGNIGTLAKLNQAGKSTEAATRNQLFKVLERVVGRGKAGEQKALKELEALSREKKEEVEILVLNPSRRKGNAFRLEFGAVARAALLLFPNIKAVMAWSGQTGPTTNVLVLLGPDYRLTSSDAETLQLALGRVKCVTDGEIKSINPRGLHLDITWIGQELTSARAAAAAAAITSTTPPSYTAITLHSGEGFPHLPAALVAHLGGPMSQHHGGGTIDIACVQEWQNGRLGKIEVMLGKLVAVNPRLTIPRFVFTIPCPADAVRPHRQDLLPSGMKVKGDLDGICEGAWEKACGDGWRLTGRHAHGIKVVVKQTTKKTTFVNKNTGAVKIRRGKRDGFVSAEWSV